MTRTADAQRRAELLEAIADYVFDNGLSDLSLRPLAHDVGSSPRVLLYYFGSKEALVQEVLSVVRRRQVEAFGSLREREFAGAGEVCLAVWEIMTQPKHFAMFRLFFEVFGLALRDRSAYRDFLDHVVEDWIEFFATSYMDNGLNRDDARIAGTVLLAGYRGFLMDLCATGDRKRVNSAFRLWLASLNRSNPC